MESTGAAGRIQFSAATANLLMKAGGEQWLELRDQSVQVKGKGDMVTYWLSPVGFLHLTSAHGGSVPSSLYLRSGDDEDTDRMARLVEWNTSELFKLLQRIVAHHNKVEDSQASGIEEDHTEHTRSLLSSFESIPISEMKEVLPLAAFKGNSREKPSREKLKISNVVRGQLRNFVQTVADSYSDNEFHNFAHSSHVCLSVIKYLNRITASSNLVVDADGPLPPSKAAALMHERTFGIATDPLVQFTCVFAALIMDIDHPGKLHLCLKSQLLSLKCFFYYPRHSQLAVQAREQKTWSEIFRQEYQGTKCNRCKWQAP